jgi:hypothetical protein
MFVGKLFERQRVFADISAKANAEREPVGRNGRESFFRLF